MLLVPRQLQRSGMTGSVGCASAHAVPENGTLARSCVLAN